MCNCNSIEVNPTATIAPNGTVTVAILFQLLNAKFVAHVKDSEGNIVATLTEASDPELNLPEGTYELCVDSFVVKADCCYGESCQCAKPSGCLCSSFEVVLPIVATINFQGQSCPFNWNGAGISDPTYFYLQPVGGNVLPITFMSALDLSDTVSTLTGVTWQFNETNCTLTSTDPAAAPFNNITITAENV